MVFAPDEETQSLIPLTTFDGNASGAGEWRQAASAAASGSGRPSAVTLRHPLTGEPASVLFRRAENGSLLAAVGGQPHPARLEWATRLLPAVSLVIRCEEARGIARQARQNAAAAHRDALEAEARATEASRLKDDFLATISHELRTPLNAMMGWAQMLRLYRNDQSVWDRALEAIDRNARAQTQIVCDLLDISRIITGKLRLRLSRVDLSDVVRAGCDTLRPTLDAKNIQLNIEVRDVPGIILGDPDRLHQVVWNLVSNAAKFTPPGGHVDVRLDATDGFAAIRVTDTGIGIRPEFIPHVFERFRQFDSGASRAHGGLGLGLAIVRHLVELHGGAVDAGSDGDNRGATFTVRLPYRPVIATTSTLAAQSVALPPARVEVESGSRDARWR